MPKKSTMCTHTKKICSCCKVTYLPCCFALLNKSKTRNTDFKNPAIK